MDGWQDMVPEASDTPIVFHDGEVSQVRVSLYSDPEGLRRLLVNVPWLELGDRVDGHVFLQNKWHLLGDLATPEDVEDLMRCLCDPQPWAA